MFLLLNVFLFYSFMLWKPCNSQYRKDTTSRALAGKTNKLTRELLLDAEMKVYSIDHFKSSYESSKAFQYGTIVYKIRSRFRRMIIIYNETVHTVDVEDTEKNVDKVAEMDNLKHEIMVFVEMIQLRESGGKRAQMKSLRQDEAKIWENLAESEDTNVPPLLQPTVNNETSTAKRKNRVWHAAVPSDFNK
ncbi:hypothetical protein B5X24_HaOG205346 [Helicoverpa armigera]|uniref:Uncharacterized protein n=1 Tax=Helicoverpa armigera TaxID=29058 RepID=A0A2W1BQI5_HELAM|nr:hypothetical protein B5X24_HaOG205346 [Helicoverpa armigera]